MEIANAMYLQKLQEQSLHTSGSGTDTHAVGVYKLIHTIHVKEYLFKCVTPLYYYYILLLNCMLTTDCILYCNT